MHPAKHKTCRDQDVCLGRVAEAAGVGIGLVDFNGRFIEANRTLCRLLGYDPKTLRRRKLFQLCPPEHSSECFDLFQHLTLGLCEEVDLELRVVRHDRQHAWVHLTAHLVPGTCSVVVTMHDSTDYLELLNETDDAYTCRSGGGTA